ncbi:Extradiol aromatic ring-opening dioxygenase [Atractiella rhizophila]|nr:Extradiol aromatic ring-opening dioxygenase [Atractiella rhizophila]
MRMNMGTIQGGSDSLLSQFLKDFGNTLLEKYKPKAILVFSAHWETYEERLVTDYGDSNPLLYDYYGFPKEMYEFKYESRGDQALSQRVVELFKQAGLKARTTTVKESRGQCGSNRFREADSGLDHGVFVPFIHMFPNPQIPIVQASIDSSLEPEDEWKIGQSVTALRDEGILILSGGLTIHTFRDRSAFNPDTAAPMYHEFLQEFHKAALVEDDAQRKKDLFALARHPTFRKAHPREDHFVPLYIGAGAGEKGKTLLLEGMYGTGTIAFGL